MTAPEQYASTGGHEPFHLSQAAFFIIHILVIVSYYMTMPLPVLLAGAALVATPALWFTWRSRNHRPSTCTRCTRVVLDATDDPSKFSPVFRGAHLIMRPAEWIAKATRIHPEESSNTKIIAVTIASMVAVYSPVVATVFIVPFPWQFLTATIGFTVITRVVQLHERLVMFCPICRDRGHGDDKHTPHPQPQPSAYIT